MPVLAAAAGLAALGMTAQQLLTPGPPQATFGSLSDWLRDLAFLAYLGLSVAAMASARQRGLAPRAAVALVATGYGLIFIGVIAGLILQEDPSWFFVLGGPGILLSLAGFITWAVVSGRSRTLPPWAAVWCGLGGLLAILGAEVGLSAVIGLFWLWLALRTR